MPTRSSKSPVHFSRRKLLRATAGSLAAATSLALPRFARAEGNAAEQQSVFFRMILPALFRDGPKLSAELSIRSVQQGGAVRVRANYRPPATATLFGRQYVLSDEVAGSVGFVGIGTDDPPGWTDLTVQITNVNGEVEYTTVPVEILATDWTVDYIDLPPSSGEILEDPVQIQEEVERLAAIYSVVVPKLWDGQFLHPVPGALVSGYFGEQRSFNGGPVSGHHGGTDFGVVEGTPVFATNRGVVVLSEELFVRGNMIIVDHGGGVFSGYAHMSSLAVEAGKPVNKGQFLGYSGATGFVAGAHLHWEISCGGVLVDGLRWLNLSQGF